MLEITVHDDDGVYIALEGCGDFDAIDGVSGVVVIRV